MIACMGGWCNTRDRCANYYAKGNPVERLCGPTEEIQLFVGQDRAIRDPEITFSDQQGVRGWLHHVRRLAGRVIGTHWVQGRPGRSKGAVL